MSNIATPGKTREIINKYNLRANKSLGQNFLVDQNIASGIVKVSEINNEDLVLEVGPGIGGLTAELAQNAGGVIAIEIDRRLLPVLAENLAGYDNVRIIHGDILKLDVSEIINEYCEEKGRFQSIKVVANLPYYITTPIIMKLLEEGAGIKQMTFMVQKEVADRITAAPGSKIYGALSVAVQYYCQPKRVLSVPPHSFMPQPGVDSEVILLKVLESPRVAVKDSELFFRIVKSAFAQRRKTILNALNNSGTFRLSKEEIAEVLAECGIDENQRGETLSILQYGILSDAFYDKIISD